MSIIIRKRGFYESNWSRKSRSYVEKQIKDPLRLLSKMGRQVVLDDVTFGDFIKLVAKMDSGSQTLLAMLVDSNFQKFLPTINDESVEEDREPLSAIECYSYAEICNHDDSQPLPSFSFYHACHGVGKQWEHDGKPVDGVDCNTYAIEFTPWCQLRGVPLTIKKTLSFCETVWVKGKRRKIISNGGNAKWNFSNRDLKETIQRTLGAPDMSLFNWLSALFGGVAFFGTPVSRDNKSKELDLRVKAVGEK